MAGVWMVMLFASAASAQTNTAESPGTSTPDDRARALARERDAMTIISIVAGAQINQTATSNIGDSVEPLPSVGVDRVLGQVRFARIRGLDPTWGSVQVDGDRLPSTALSTRTTPLDILPGDLFEVIQVSRTLSANMDGDAIAGVINLVPRRPTEQLRGSLSLNGGYHGQRGDADDLGVNGMFGRRVANGRVGFTFGGSSLRETLSGNGFGAIYRGSDMIAGLIVRSAVIDRTRAGGQGTVDVKLSDRSAFAFSGLIGRLHDHRYDRGTMFTPGLALDGQGRIDRALSDQPSSEILGSGGVRGQQLLRGEAALDFNVTGARGREHDPGTLATIYSAYPVTMNPNFSGPNFDPNNLQPNAVDVSPQAYGSGFGSYGQEIATDTSVTAGANVTLPLPIRAGAGKAQVIKFGVKARTLTKSRDHADGSADSPSFSSVIDPNVNTGDILDGRYTLGPSVNPSLLRSQSHVTIQPSSALVSDYTGHERLLAGYAMGQFALGSRLTIEPGVRYEWTSRRYNAFSQFYDFDSFETTPLHTSTDEGEWLPMVSARYAATGSTTLRAAVTRTFARPDFGSLAPYAIGVLGSYFFQTGNPDLRSTSSWNTDFMIDQQLAHGSGRLFAGLFHKRITDPVYIFQIPNVTRFAQLEFSSLGWPSVIVQQPRNGDRASLTGVEMGYEQPLRFLPGVWSGLSVRGNYTFSDSSALTPFRVGDGRSPIFPDRPGHDVTLPGVPRHLGHLAVSFDQPWLSARMSLSMQSSAMTSVGAFAWEDGFIDHQTRLDLSFTRRLTTHLRAFADIFNVTNAPLRAYQGDSSHPMVQENYGRWATFGVRMAF